MDIEELQKQFVAAMTEVNDLGTKVTAGTATDDERTRWLGSIEKAEGIKSQIGAAQKAADLEEWGRKSAGLVPTVSGGRPAIQASEPAGQTEIGKGGVMLDEGPAFGAKAIKAIGEKDYGLAFRTYLRKGLHGLSTPEIKTLQEGVDDAGGFLVPLDMLNRIISRLPTPTRVGGRVTTFSTGRDKVSIPIVNYTTDDLFTTGMRITWTGEVPASSTAMRVTQPVFSQVSVPIYTAMMSMPITNDIVEDALFPIVNWSSDKFMETVDLLKDNQILTGSGVGQPAGILLNPGGTNQPAVVNYGNPITADGVISVPWTLPEQYDENGCWIFNKVSTGQAIAKLKDSQNRYLWTDFMAGLAQGPGEGNGGSPASRRTLQGYPVLFSGFMPNQAANAFSAVFGDPSGYYLVNRVGFSVQVLRELYAETNQILLLGRLRFGGLVAEPWKLKIAKNA